MESSDTWAISSQKTSLMSEQLPHTYKLYYSTLHKQDGTIPNKYNYLQVLSRLANRCYVQNTPGNNSYHACRAAATQPKNWSN